jgi:hypothetical protein
MRIIEPLQMDYKLTSSSKTTDQYLSNKNYLFVLLVKHVKLYILEQTPDVHCTHFAIKIMLPVH